MCNFPHEPDRFAIVLCGCRRYECKSHFVFAPYIRFRNAIVYASSLLPALPAGLFLSLPLLFFPLLRATAPGMVNAPVSTLKPATAAITAAMRTFLFITIIFKLIHLLLASLCDLVHETDRSAIVLRKG